jgi:hypothetical protein
MLHRRPAAFAREGHEELSTAFAAAHPGKAALEDAAVEVGANGHVGEAAQEAVAALAPLLPPVADIDVVGLDEVAQRRRLELARAVERAVGGKVSHGSVRSRCLDGGSSRHASSKIVNGGTGVRLRVAWSGAPSMRSPTGWRLTAGEREEVGQQLSHHLRENR